MKRHIVRISRESLEVMKGMLYKAYRMTIDTGRGTTEIMLMLKLSNVTKLASKHRRPSRNHSQKDISLPLIVSFCLS